MFGYSLTPIVRALLLINIGIYAIAELSGHYQWFDDNMALRYFGSEDFRIHQIVTHMFMHASFMHLLSNMFGLFMFGPWLEKMWGATRFLIFYMVCGIGAALIFTLINAFHFNNIKEKIDAYKSNPNPYSYELIINKQFSAYKKNPRLSLYYYDFPRTFEKDPNNQDLINSSVSILESFYNSKINIPMVGASGAIFGILLGFGMLFPNTLISFLFIPVPIKAKYLVTFYGLYEIYLGFKNNPNDTVAHFAHLGGMIFAFIMIMYWKKKRDSFY